MIEYRIKRFSSTDRRRQTKYILVVQLSYFINRDITFPPNLLQRSNYYHFNEIKNYFYNRMKKEQLPFHYLVEHIDNDWDCLLGAPLSMKSWWLENVIANSYISPLYRDAIVVCVHDDWGVDIPSPRSFKAMASKIIAPTLTLNRLNFRDSVVLFHEEFDYDSYNQDLFQDETKLKYRFRVDPVKYFDKTTFNLECMDFT